MNTKTPLTLGLLAITTLALAACTSTPEAQPTTTAPEAVAPTVQANTPPTSDEDAGGKPVVGAPEANDVDESIQKVAEQFIHERENQASYNRKKPEDWLKAVKPIMTASGYKQLTAQVGGGADAQGGYAWDVSHEKGLAVKAKVGKCLHLTQAGGSATEKTVTCSVIDIVVGKDGQPITSSDIPSTWPFVGEQQDALLTLKKEGGGWKVEMDATGMAN